MTRKILLKPEFDFFIPDYYLAELNKSKSDLLEKVETEEVDLNKLIFLLHERIFNVPEQEYSKNIKKAEEIIGSIDSKDIPFLAVALSLNVNGIWSNDKHFQRQKKIPIYYTTKLREYLKEIEKYKNLFLFYF
ncbi:MAG TPA: PIN domain-containing protein [Candidatus Lokiarchaeia archaeon]